MASKRRRARRGVICGLVAFLACQLGLAYVIQFRRPAWHDPIYGTKADRLAIQLRHAPPNNRCVVVLGSSRAACGVSGREVEDALRPARPTTVSNFAVTAGGPILELLTFNRLLDGGVRPDVVVVEVLPALISREFQGVEASQFPVERYALREYAAALRCGAEPERLRRAGLESLLLPAYSHRVRMWQDVAPEWLPPRLRYEWTAGADAWGTVPMRVPEKPPVELRRRALALTAQQYRDHLAAFVPADAGDEALRELLTRCRQEGCRVVLLWMPEGPTFRGWYSGQARSDALSYVAGLQAEFGCGFIDAQEWMGEDDFVDSHHLLEASGRAFSRRLGQELAAVLDAATVEGRRDTSR